MPEQSLLRRPAQREPVHAYEPTSRGVRHGFSPRFLFFGPRFCGSLSHRTLLQAPQRFGFSIVSANHTLGQR